VFCKWLKISIRKQSFVILKLIFIDIGDVTRPPSGLPKTLFSVSKGYTGPLIFNPFEDLHILQLNLLILPFTKRPIEGPGIDGPGPLLPLLRAHNPGDLLKEEPVFPFDLGVLGLHHEIPLRVVSQDRRRRVLPNCPDRVVGAHLLDPPVVLFDQRGQLLLRQVVLEYGLLFTHNKYINAGRCQT
jgi:hypothetical protein